MALSELQQTSLAFLNELNQLANQNLSHIVLAFQEADIKTFKQDAKGIERVVEALQREFPHLLTSKEAIFLCRAWLKELILSTLLLPKTVSKTPRRG